MDGLFFSILIPTYNGGYVLKETLNSILNQGFTNYEIIIQDDVSKDNTEEVVRSIKDKRIHFYKNSVNLGYPKNLEECRKKANGDILFLMGQDDILAKDALMRTCEIFRKDAGIGAVTRPYYWFQESIDRPVRATGQLNPDADEIVSIHDSPERIRCMFDTLGQLSGLAFRKKFMDLPFHEDIFPCHIYPFASILKKRPVVFLKDYTIAVRIATSQTRLLSSIYKKSPVKSWVEMFQSVYSEPEFKKIKEFCIKNIASKNYVGLVQIRNYGKYRYLLREIFYLIKYRPQNLLSLRFWFFSLGCIILPAFILIPMVDWYKKKLYSQFLKHIRFEYNISEPKN